ncbi:MAG: response regulator [Clostridiales bacterium]|nr:response regulator [Clostridiales bacterium]
MTEERSQKSIIDYLLPLLNAASNSDGAVDDSAEMHAAKQIRTFIDEIPGGFLIYRADSDEKIVYANSALINIFKCDDFADFIKLTGGTFRGIVHRDDFERVEAEITDQISHSENQLDYVEYRIVRKDGIVRWVEDYGHYFKSNAGDCYYVFITDATERLTRQLADKASMFGNRSKREQRLQNIIEEYDKERKLIRQEHLQRLEVIEGLSANYDSIIYADIDKNVALPYRLSTRLVRQFTKKLEVRELRWFLDDYVDVWVHPDDRDLVRQQTSPEFIQAVLAEKDTYYINYRCIQNDETQYIQLRIVNVSGEDNKPSQIVMGYRNIDEEVLQEMRQKQLLEAALQNAKIADNAKTTFLSNMSHDMRTPLNAIFGYVKLARKSAPEDSNIRRYLNRIETAGNQILDLVDKVLELSYAESRDDTLLEAPFNLKEALKSEINKLMPVAEENGVKLHLRTAAVTNADVIGDKDKLMQIISNIVDNAIKYNKQGGKVDVTVTEKTGLLNNISTYTIDIKDNGIGISQDTLNRIFEPFIRESNTTQSGVFGAGLGLTICKQLAETMNATISAKSTLGRGSTFTVAIALKPDMHEDEIQATDEQIDLSGKKILIVEDNEINLEIETELLEDLGFVVDSAANGKIAVDKIRAARETGHEYDLVLMDIQMPVMDGRAAAREIRALKGHPLANVPIIALSANAFESDRRASLEAGMDAHINKPLDVNMLIEAINAAVAKQHR